MREEVTPEARAIARAQQSAVDRLRSLLHDPIHRPLCRDPKPMTGARILRIAGNAGFCVSWHYRNASLRKWCAKLKRAGLLAPDRVRSRGGEDWYCLTPAGWHALNAKDGVDA